MIEATRFSLDVPPPSTEPAVLAQWVERGAAIDMLNAVPLRLRAALEPFTERAPGVVAYGARGIDSWLLNRVFVGGEGSPVDAAGLRAVLERVSARGVSPFIHVAADAQQ